MMPSWNETYSNLPNKNDSTSGKPKKRLSPILSKKLRVNYKFYSLKDSYDYEAEAIKAGIRDWLDDSLKVEKSVYEGDLSEIAELEKIYGGEIVKCNSFNEKGRSDFDIRLPPDLLQRFGEKWREQNFRSASQACRAIMLRQIKIWKEKYEASVNVEKTIAVEPEDLKKLKLKLEELKQTYGLGLELASVWIPKIKSDKEAEVIGSIIYIYSLTYEEAEFWLEHEYHEYCQHLTSSKPLVDAMNLTLIFWKMVLEYFNKEGYKKREKYIETLLENLKKKQATS